MTDWMARADALSGTVGAAKVPNGWVKNCLKDQNPYIVLIKGAGTSEAETIILKAVPSGVEESTQLIVVPGTFGLADTGTTPVATKSWSSREYRWNWLWRTTAGHLTVLGLLIVVLGQVAQVTLDAGVHWTPFNIGTSGMKVLQDILTFGGAALAAWQVALNS